MRFDLFEKLTLDQAQELLRQFKEDGAANIDGVRAEAAQCGVIADYRMESLPNFLRWAFLQMQILPTNPDTSESGWIQSTPENETGSFEFDEDSKNLICFVACYVGECFVRNYPQLRWATGNPEFAKCNMPVVVGFQHGKELAPMLMLENVFGRVIEMPDYIGDIAVAIDTWRSYLE
ncbi:MAG TPA: hypothetical protein VJ828_03010 [Lacipirellulaceae bacterium]|nr:hypothetical protein [Lacipirellulaceae bacterium]